MSRISRRLFVAGALAPLALAACSNGIGSQGAAEIDARATAALDYLYRTYPDTQGLAQRASGILVMPLMTKIGLGLGGTYGRGVLRVGNTTVDYYSAASASAGIQIGAQQYSHVLFFMTPDALADFRASPGWVAGAGVDYAIAGEGETLLADTTTSMSRVIAVIFGQSGLRVGATIEGTKYTRIIP